MRPMPSEDEQRLLARAKAGDERAFEELIRSHADRLYAVVIRMVGDRHEAEEVTQEAFLRAWRGIGSFEGSSRFFTWLYRIGINEAKRRVARNATTFRASSIEERPTSEPADLSHAPEPTATQRELQAVLEKAIAALDPDHRATLILRDVQGLSTAEAAEAMGLGEPAFKSRLHRARLAVRKAVDGYLEGDR